MKPRKTVIEYKYLAEDEWTFLGEIPFDSTLPEIEKWLSENALPDRLEVPTYPFYRIVKINGRVYEDRSYANLGRKDF